MKFRYLLLLVFGYLASCADEPASTSSSENEAGAETIAEIHAYAESGDGDSAGITDPALLPSANGTGDTLVIGAGGRGLELFGLNGDELGVAAGSSAGFVNIVEEFSLDGVETTLVLALLVDGAELAAFRFDVERNKLEKVSDGLYTHQEAEGLCTYRSPISGASFAFVVGEGVIQQWELFESKGSVGAQLARTVPVGLGAAHCAVDDASGVLYVSVETMGFAGIPAEPESEAVARYIDLAEPYGRFLGDVKGIAIYPGESGGYIVVSDADESLLRVYDLASYDYKGVFRVVPEGAVDGVKEPEGLAASSRNLGDGLESGVLVLADDENDDGATNLKLVSWSDIAAALNLPSIEGRSASSSAAVAAVRASIETAPVDSLGDAADDPAIWVHPTDPGQSTIIGTDKKRGINVYALDGSLIQSLADGKINNAEVRYGFSLGGQEVDLVTGSNRTSRGISVWMVNPDTRHLEDVAAGVLPTGMDDPYGQCMYKSPASGNYYVFINDTDGIVKQWRLFDNGEEKVDAELVREFAVGSQTEGCVADDVTGDLYVGEEGVGIWKYSAEPDGGDSRISVDNTETGHLTADVEGLSLYYGPGGTGYLVASNQGADNYVIYEREGDNRYIGHFHIVANAALGIDGVSETDGLAVTSANLGPRFPNGLLAVQDGRNITPKERQNFKLVPWEYIANALELSVHEGYDPRRTGE